MAGQDDASELVARHATDDLAVAGPEEPAPAAAPSTARSAAVVTVGIILSRLFGLLRQRVVGHYFGLSIYADVISVAFKIGNVTQNLLGEGTLSASFIPVYARARAGGKNAEAVRFALAALGFLLLLAGTASAVGVAVAPLLSRGIAAGSGAEEIELTTRVVRVVFPMTGLLVLSAWGLGVLNAHRRFFLPYAAPVLWSVAQIAALLACGAWLGQRGEPLMMALCWGALAGAFLQMVVLLPAARALLGSLAPTLDRADPNLREAAARLPNALLGRGVMQLSAWIDTVLVSFLGKGDQAVMQAAQLVYLLPMAVLGTGEAAASLPEMASDTVEEDRARRDAALQKRLGDSLARVTALTVPATLVLALLGREVIRVLLQSGSFDRAATERVQAVVFAYAFALLGNASARVLTTMAYAIGDTRTPARYAVYRVIASTVGSLVLMQWYGVVGVVLGAVIAAWVETFALGWKLGRTLGGLGLARIRAGRVALLGAASIAPALGLKWALPEAFEQGLLGSTLVLAVFCAAFAVAAPALGLFDVRSLLRRRR